MQSRRSGSIRAHARDGGGARHRSSPTAQDVRVLPPPLRDLAQRFREDPQNFTLISEMGAANFEKVRSYVDLADHYLAELIVQAQADGYFAGLEIDEALSLINQMISPYAIPDTLIYLGDKLTEDKLARIIDTIFTGLSGEMGDSARGTNTLKVLN
jgi:TetR/AcrR family transcriptional repressor of the ameABC operon